VHDEQRPDDGQERDAIQREADGHAERDERGTGDERPDDPREIELNGIEGNRVRQMLFVDERRNE